MAVSKGFLVASLISLFVIVNTADSEPAFGTSSCDECHEMPPLDAAYRNISTGGFKGNHLTHNPPKTAPPVACDKCHSGSSQYTTAHRNGFINITTNINDSPHPASAHYNKPRFFNQTSNPVLTTCANVNCHFEQTTPVWGSEPAATGCSTCHGAPPGDGSHPAHGAFQCLKCHPDHTAETQPFSHATSVRHRPLLVQFTAAPNAGGTYFGDVSYPNYLPSQGPARTGNCENLYCHSDGRGGAPGVTPSWSGTLRENCSGCHGSAGSHGAPEYANEGAGRPRANSHDRHVHGAADCGRCHAGTTVSGSAIKAGSVLHVNGVIDVTFDAAIVGEGASLTAGSSTCSAVYCHSDGTSVSTGLNAGGSATWGGASPGCGGCHAYPPAYETGLPKANSHTRHDFGCSTCHAGTTADGVTIASGSLHGNHAYDVSPGSGISFSYVYASTGGRCSEISCHNNGTAVWGSTLTCGDCHSVSPGGD